MPSAQYAARRCRRQEAELAHAITLAFELE
jgi:hypothetical protein